MQCTYNWEMSTLYFWEQNKQQIGTWPLEIEFNDETKNNENRSYSEVIS